MGTVADRGSGRTLRSVALADRLVIWLAGSSLPRRDPPADATYLALEMRAGTRPPLLRGTQLLRAWWLTVTVAEFAGFAVPATAGAWTADMPAAVSVPVLLAAGAIEGSMLGWGQASVLRRALPTISAWAWIAATAAAAVLAYAIGLVPSNYYDSIALWPTPIIAVVAALLGGALLASIGTVQWFILRRHVAGAAWWVATTALAWLAGLGIFLGFTTPLWEPGQPIVLIILIGVLGGLLMAATSSAITGLALRRLLH